LVLNKGLLSNCQHADEVYRYFRQNRNAVNFNLTTALEATFSGNILEMLSTLRNLAFTCFQSFRKNFAS